MRTRNTVWVAICLLPGGLWAQQISHRDVNDSTEIWRIDEPPVRARSTDFHDIRFRLYDEVEIEAGGCVQTGGAGDTWKRYVNPSGDNSDRLYYGTMRIPGLTLGLAPIRNLLGHGSYSIRTLPAHADPCDLYLQLGYEDDDYSDNGYNDHDNGTEDQCQDIGPAHVRLIITHHTAAGAKPIAMPKAPMDLWWNEVDENAYPLNAKWGRQVLTGEIPDAADLCNHFHNEDDHLNLGDPACTTQHPLVDEPDGWSDPTHWSICQSEIGHPGGTVHGHINWGETAIAGRLFFQDHQVPAVIFDNDLDWAIVRDGQDGVVKGNKFHYQGVGPVGLDLECDFDETVEHFSTPWWNDFRQNGILAHPPYTGDWTAAQRFVDKKYAVVIGLMGIDNQHEAHAELHPIHAMFIRTELADDHERWAFFARNWGNEGFCSQDQHQLSLNKIKMFFPGAVSMDRGRSDLRSNQGGAGYSVKVYPNDGVLLTIYLNDPGTYPMTHGELYFTRDPALASHEELPSYLKDFLPPFVKPLPPDMNEEAEEHHYMQLVMDRLPREMQYVLEHDLQAVRDSLPVRMDALVSTTVAAEMAIDEQRGHRVLDKYEARDLSLIPPVRAELDTMEMKVRSAQFQKLAEVMGSPEEALKLLRAVSLNIAYVPRQQAFLIARNRYNKLRKAEKR